MSRVISNAFWNSVGLGSSAFVAIAVPPFLTRSLSPGDFGIWALALQLGSYVGLFGLGVQVVVARHVARTTESSNFRTRDAIVATAFWLLVIAAILGAIAVGLTGIYARAFFSDLYGTQLATFRLVLIGVGLPLALTLPTTVFSGVFVGLQRSAIPGLTQSLTRIALACAVVVVATSSGGLARMALAYAIATLAGAVALGVMWRLRTLAPTISLALVDRSGIREFWRECAPLALWNLVTVLATSFSLVIVGRVDSSMVPYFAVVVTLTLLISGVLQAANMALLPLSAAMDASGQTLQLTRLVQSATRINFFIGLTIATPLVLSGQFVLSLWVGDSYATNGHSVLGIMVISMLFRLCLLPYSTVAVASGQQHRMLFTPIIEATAAAGAGYYLGMKSGASGVATGYFLGSLAGVSALLLQHPLRHVLGGSPALHLLRDAVPRIAISFSALALGYLAIPHPVRNSGFGLIFAILLVAVFGWTLGLTGSDREALIHHVRQLFRMGPAP